ncbi:MAG: hypothetical protein ACREV3_11220 [Gammaproteobacteria bacterium]
MNEKQREPRLASRLAIMLALITNDSMSILALPLMLGTLYAVLEGWWGSAAIIATFAFALHLGGRLAQRVTLETMRTVAKTTRCGKGVCSFAHVPQAPKETALHN